MSQAEHSPAPMSTPDCDLRGLEWMPLNATNLLDSTLFLESTGDEFKAAMALICKSWRQVPAGSLPSNERSLATLAMTENWTAVRTMALRNWVLCSDGRYYHPIVAAKAMEALPKRQDFIQKKSAEAERKERERNDRKALFAAMRAAGQVLPATTKTSELRELVAKLPKDGQQRDLSRDMSRLGEGHHTTPQGQKEGIPVGAESPAPTPAPTPSPTPHPPAASAAGNSLRGTRLPDDWLLPKAWGDWSLAEFPQWTAEKVRSEAAKFKDHWTSKTGKDATKLKWFATWCNWCRSPIAHKDDPKVTKTRDTAARNAEAARLLGHDPSQGATDAQH